MKKTNLSGLIVVLLITVMFVPAVSVMGDTGVGEHVKSSEVDAPERRGAAPVTPYASSLMQRCSLACRDFAETCSDLGHAGFVKTREWGSRAAAAMADRVEIGTRITSYTLLDDHKGLDENGDGFLGTITDLDEDQNMWPFKLYARYMISPVWGVELTWDQVIAETMTSGEGEHDRHSDGDFEATGPILTVFGRYHNDSSWTPYAGMGLGYFNASFNHAKWWHLGYPALYKDLAYDDATAYETGIRRTIDVDNAIGFVLTGGCNYEINEQVSAELYLRYTKLELDADYHYSIPGPDVRSSWDIPLDNFAIGLGINYAF